MLVSLSAPAVHPPDVSVNGIATAAKVPADIAAGPETGDTAPNLQV